VAPITGIGEQDLLTRSSQARSCRTHYATAASMPASLSPSAGPTRVLGALHYEILRVGGTSTLVNAMTSPHWRRVR
jgi:hypothetical protein